MDQSRFTNGAVEPADPRAELKETRLKLRLVETQLRLAHLERLQKQQVGRDLQRRRVRESFDGFDGPLWAYGEGEWGPIQGPVGIDSDRYFIGQIDYAWHRMYGINWPFWRTWIEHSRFRFAARVLHGYFGVAKGLLRALNGYVIGKGIPYRVVPRNGRDPRKELLRVCSDVYDEFNEENDWHGLQKELFLRSRRDGEYFLRWFPQTDGPLALRTLEPAEIVEPRGNDVRTSSFGILNPPEDIYGRLGYCWSWDGSPIDPRDAVPASEVDHVTVNVDRHVKRGLPDFFGDVYEGLKIASNTVQAMAESTRVQAELAFIVQHATATPEQVGAFVGNIDGSAGPRRRNLGGIREDIDKGQEYIAPPFAANASGFVEVLQARFRSVGVAWNLPEGITSGDWSNNNFASALMAESPFVKTAADEQAFYDRRFKRTAVAALRHAADEGRIIANDHRYTWDEIRELVDLQGEPPTIEVRDMAKEAQTNQILMMSHIQSPQTWQQKLGLDPEQEEQNFEEFQERTGGLGMQLGVGDQNGNQRDDERPPRPSRESRRRKKLLEGFDPNEPREEDGKWTTGGGSEKASSVDKDRIGKAVWGVRDEDKAVLQDHADACEKLLEDKKFATSAKWYTGKGYESLNEMSRKCPPDFSCLDPIQRKKFDTIESAIAKAPKFKSPVLLYRSIDGTNPKLNDILKQSFADAMKSGNEFSFPSLTSTSSEPGIVNSEAFSSPNAIAFQIRAKTGLAVKSISKKPQENEVIQSTKTKYKVVGMDNAEFYGRKRFTVYLEET
jgi:hypothetical protein